MPRPLARPVRLLWLICASLVGLLLSPAAADDGGEQVRLSLQRYAELMRLAEARSGAKVTWGRGSITARVEDDVVRINLSAQVRAVGDGPAEVPLLPADVVLESANIGGNSAALVRLSGAHVALLPSLSGEQTVSLSYLVTVTKGDDGSPFALIPVPPMAGASLQVSGVGGEPSAWPATAIKRSGDSLNASVPATSAIALRWGQALGRDLVRRVDYTLALDESGDGVDVTARYEVRTSERNSQVRITRVADALMDLREGTAALQGQVHDGWHTALIAAPGSHVLTARFRIAIDRTRGQPQVRLSPDAVPMAMVSVTVPGKRAVEFDPPVPATSAFEGADANARTTAVAHLPPVEAVTLRWTEARAAPENLVRANTETYQLLSLQEGVLRSKVIVKYDVIKGKLKELPIQLPENAELSKVSGPSIEDWPTFKATEDAPRQVRVMLGQEVEGQVQLELELESIVSPVEGTKIALPIVRPLNAFREMGVVALFDGDKVGFAPAQTDGMRKAGQDALPSEVRKTLRDKVSQAYKHIGAPGTLSSAVAATKTREARFDAKVNALYSVKDGKLVGRTLTLIDIKSGRLDKICVSVPAYIEAPTLKATQSNKQEKDPSCEAGEGRTGYGIYFAQALEGAIEVNVDFEVIFKKDQSDLQLPDVRIHGADVEAGAIGVEAETDFELAATSPDERLRKVDVEELPNEVKKRKGSEIRLAYTYSRAPWSMGLNIKRNKTVQTLPAVAHHAWIETHVLSNGHIVTRATYEVANEDRQFLKLKLPKSAKVLGVRTDGTKVKAVEDDSGVLAIPIGRGAQTQVEVSYDVTDDALGFYQSVDMIAPIPDVRTADIKWVVRTPSRLKVIDVDTDLREQRYGGELRNEWPRSASAELPTDQHMRETLYVYSVQDAGQAALSINLKIMEAPGEKADTTFLIVALLALLLLAWRRASGAPLSGKDWLFALVAVGALVLKEIFGRLDGGEALVLVIAPLVVGFVGRRRRKAAQRAATDEG